MKPLRAFTNAGRLRLNMLLRREAVRNYPVKAYVEPTLFCNLRCPACPTGQQFGLRPSATIDVNLFKQALDQVGPYLFELNMFNWGEPLLHKQTPEMIRYAKDKGVEMVMLSSNLSVPLTDDYVERLVASGLDKIIIGLDGASAETYTKYRRKGDIELVRRNMMRIREAKERLGSATPEVTWQFLVFRHNEHEIGVAQSLYREWGADLLDVHGAEMPAGEEGFEPSTIPEYNIYDPTHAYRRQQEEYKQTGKPCSWLYGVFLLNPNGKVSPCCAVPDEADDFGEYGLGGSFLDTYNSPRFRQARSGKDAGAKERGRARKYASLPVMGVPQKSAELVCSNCPIPYDQNEALRTIDDAAEGLLQSFHREASPWAKGRRFVSYLLMGAPGARKRLPSFLTLGANSPRVFLRTVGHVLRHAK
jgi:MoaA/NifB/PqqE/SkfB family radical SAM enzyme